MREGDGKVTEKIPEVREGKGESKGEGKVRERLPELVLNVERFLNEQDFEASMLSKRVLLVPTTTSYELNVVISLITAF